ncbi:MAG TPA: DUF3109 domain-containing protein [Cryomorphaceae bacterium]|nr:hypothetical protein [Owenweeksia sp.]MBF99482.1 hypothetical protein [Owenweeksia sp.]HAD96832.1 DUF3109 domain-containing protein [Cryomorphaceae bacterium]HBF19143.1 DUF3109 domain-containing protein [Cryomorphaceae bacterium]HCQ15400.1 DUF3109 domain-containing protein [Cryomorphaceae bacterium]|tara:strand:- start:91 stop:666 length:576 start_codon:yes stop_codon:yes gene_type:complete
MIAIQETLISEDLLEKEFVCNLSACKGACCVEGDAGAPLETAEVRLLEEIYKDVAPYLREEGRQTIEKQGVAIRDPYDGEWVTPLVNGAECAYVIFDEKGVSKCGIEKAWEQGAVNWQKPVSCHLYPIRITRYPSYDAVNYHRWQICSPACDLGKQLEVPVYKFVKDALIRKYGSEWYAELEEVASYWLKK